MINFLHRLIAALMHSETSACQTWLISLMKSCRIYIANWAVHNDYTG